jgi:hypothetical protein
MLTEHPYVRPARPKESVQNVRSRAVIATIAPESGPNRHWLPVYIWCRTCAAQHMGRLGLGEHSKCVARVRTRIVAGFVACNARRCLADRVVSAESLEPALTLRDAKTKAGQNPPQFVYADPDVMCLRYRFDISQPGFLEFHQKRSPTLLCGRKRSARKNFRLWQA